MSVTHDQCDDKHAVTFPGAEERHRISAWWRVQTACRSRVVKRRHPNRESNQQPLYRNSKSTLISDGSLTAHRIESNLHEFFVRRFFRHCPTVLWRRYSFDRSVTKWRLSLNLGCILRCDNKHFYLLALSALRDVHLRRSSRCSASAQLVGKWTQLRLSTEMHSRAESE